MSNDNGSQQIGEGSVWTCIRGPHTGNTATVLRVTPTSVQVRHSGTGDSWDKGKNDGSRNSVKRAAFLANYQLSSSLVPGETRGGRSFRQTATPRPKPVATPPAGQPTLGLIETRGAPLNLEILDITPAQAAAWLANGGANRKLDVRRVNRFVITMRRGEWQLTGDSIKLDAHGRVRDGQHRLSAIVQGGMPVKSLVVRGVDEAAFDVIDTGRARTVAHVLEIHGQASSTAIAAAIRVLILIERFGRIGVATDEERAAATAPVSLAYLKAHPEIIEAHALCEPVRKVLFGGSGLWTAMFTLFWRVDQEAAVAFADQLATGVGLAKDAPALKLRNRTLGKARRGQMRAADRQDLSVIIAKAWNAYRRGETIGTLRAGDNEQIPELA